MSDKSSITSEFSHCELESDNDLEEGVMSASNITTEHQREASPTADVDKSQESPPSASLVMEQKPAEETITIGQSESKDALDLLEMEQVEMSDAPKPEFTHKMSVPKQNALEIFTKTNDGQFEVNEANLAAILLQPEIRGLPVVLINCVGVKRSGKSFLLNFFLLFLQKQGKRGGNNPKWLEEAAKGKDGNFPGMDSFHPGGRLPNGFSYRGGIKPETKGILMWSQPFVVETPTGQPVAVVLADSEGSFDWNQSKQHDTLIFSMSVLTSSLLIYNVRNQPDANMLDNLLYFANYGKMAGSKNATQDMDSKPFQELLFLVRDWPGSGGYGFNGGQPLLEEMLAMESPSNDENQIRGKSIRGLFDRIQCFLMAYPGEKVAEDNNQFQGSLNDMSDRFKLHMEELVFDSLSPDHIERAIKCIGNVPVTCELLYHHFVECGKVFRMSAGTLPSANTFYEASTAVILTQAFDKAKKNYIMKMDRDIRTKYMLFGWNFWDNKKPLSEADLQVIHRGAKLSALKCFDQTRKMGSTEKLKKFREELTSEIEDIFDKKYKRDNDNKRRLKEQKEAYEKQLKEQEERHKKAYEEVARMAVPKNPLSLGIEVEGGIFSIIIPRDSVLPATYKRHYTTLEDNQTNIYGNKF